MEGFAGDRYGGCIWMHLGMIWMIKDIKDRI